MNENYDVIILGTGLKECILSGLLSVAGKKVLHLDRNDFYGAESASLNLKQLYANYEGGDAKVDENQLGPSKNYSVDLCPKFIMGCGNLVKMLLHTQVTRYLEFRCVDGSFVYQQQKLYEVPMTPQAALSSSLMGLFQKRRYQKFLEWVLGVDRKDKKTWSGLDLEKIPMRQVFDYWKCDENTQNFTGHAVALYTDDSYLDNPNETFPCLERLQLYALSLARFEKSPYIYPVWGLGGLPEGFSRLAAVYGGVYMLRHQVKEILYENGKVKGIAIKGEKEEGTATCKQLIGDPTYFKDSDKVKKTGQIAKWLCILNHAVEGTRDSNSAQIILPCKQTGHKSDIYISVMSASFNVTPKGIWVAMISSNVYTANPKNELMVAYKLLGKTLKDFFFVTDTYVAANDSTKDNVFIPSSMDATTHFEDATEEVMKIYKNITGMDVDLTKKPSEIDEQMQ